MTRSAARLAAAGVEAPRLDARLLLGIAMDLAPENLLVAQDSTEDQLARFEALISRRAAREPLAYIVGQKEFWSLDFEVGPGVLIPRPETETLIEEALLDFPDNDAPLDVADLGTGSGCLLIAFLESFPNAKGIGIDRSAEALAWARRNASRHGLEERCVLSQADWTEAARGNFRLFCSPTRPTSLQGSLAGRRRRFGSMSRRTRLWAAMTGSKPIGNWLRSSPGVCGPTAAPISKSVRRRPRT